MYMFANRVTWAKIVNRLLKLIMLWMNRPCSLELSKCLDFFGTFILWGQSISALQIIADPHTRFREDIHPDFYIRLSFSELMETDPEVKVVC